jgi:hypothetical protein
MTTLLALPGVVRAAMWVGGELGPNFTLDSTFTVNGASFRTTSFKPSVIGGLTVGYDFIDSGFLAYHWPGWMKYFSFAMDFTYNRFSVSSRDQGLGFYIPYGSHVDGYQAVWTFLFIGHYGFYPDSEVPSGRIVPYLGVGPAIMFSGLDFGKVRRLNIAGDGLGQASSTNIALVVEPGIRFMALKNVSIDTAMRYRFAAPSYDFSGITVKTDALHQLALLVRASYHF